MKKWHECQHAERRDLYDKRRSAQCGSAAIVLVDFYRRGHRGRGGHRDFFKCFIYLSLWLSEVLVSRTMRVAGISACSFQLKGNLPRCALKFLSVPSAISAISAIKRDPYNLALPRFCVIFFSASPIYIFVTRFTSTASPSNATR